MRSLYKVILIAALVLFLFLTPHACLGQQSAFHQEVFTSSRPGSRIAAGLATGWHQLAWDTSGSPGACLLGLDYSTDGMVWYLSGSIPQVDCTHSGSTFFIGPQHVAYVRMNMSSLASPAAVRATYSGFQTNPGPPTGTVTSVFGRTGQVLAVQGDYNVSQITGAAPLFSPNFSGLPTAPPPPSATDNSNAIATTAWVTQFVGTPGGGGGGNATGLTFGTTSIPMSSTVPTAGQCLSYNGTSISGAACGTSGGGGIGGSGTINTIPKFVTNSTTLGDSLLADDATTLTYTGSGGITAPKFSVPTGAMVWESAPGSPPAPVSGRNMLVSGADGWYVSNLGAAFVGPIGVGGGGTGGAVTSVFGRLGNVVAATGDYDVSQVTNAAAIGSPQFTGTPTAPTPVAASDDTSIATTGWVRANIVGGGGGGVQPITHGIMTPQCTAQATVGTTYNITSGINIQLGDTVAVSVTTGFGPTTLDVTDGGGNVYTAVPGATQSAANLQITLFASHNVTHAATTMQTTSGLTNNRMVVCVATYRNVAAVNQAGFANAPAGTPNTSGINFLTTGNNNFIFAGIAASQAQAAASITTNSGTRLATANAVTTVSSNSICENDSPIPATIRCEITLPSPSITRAAVFELEAGVPAPAPLLIPQIAKYVSQSYTDSAPIPSTVLCAATDCPPGLYRLSRYINISHACTTGGSITMLHTWTDSVGAKTVDMGTPSPLALTSTGDSVGGNIHVFQNSGTAAISYSTTTVACTTGTGAGTIYIVLERLQ